MKFYQKERIELIRQLLPQFGEEYVLKGGTALMLYYGLDRFSEDIDLDSYGEMNMLDKIKNPGYEKWNVRIVKDIPTVFRVLIDYGAKSDLGDYPLKIEISSRNTKMLKNNLFKINSIEGVKVYDISELVNIKVATFGNRDKIRDFYDLGYLIKKHPEHFSEEQLKSIVINMQYKGLENLSLQLKEEFRIHNLGNELADDYVLNFYIECEDLLINKKTIENEDGWDMEI